MSLHDKIQEAVCDFCCDNCKFLQENNKCEKIREQIQFGAEPWSIEITSPAFFVCGAFEPMNSDIDF